MSNVSNDISDPSGKSELSKQTKISHFEPPALIDGESSRAHEGQAKKIRGRPFQSGNAGRPRGAKNKTTRLVEQLLQDDAEQLTRKLVDLAKAGDAPCLRLLFDRLLPRRNGRPIDIDLPPVTNANDAVNAIPAIFTAVSNGTITPGEASDLTDILNTFVRVLEVHDLASRLEAIETRLTEISPR